MRPSEIGTPTIQPVFYGPVDGAPHRLTAPPALASWDAAGSPGQDRSNRFIDEVARLVADDVVALPDPLGIRLDVGLPPDVSLNSLNDLDNYLFPLVPRLSERLGRSFATVQASKRHSAESLVAVAEAKLGPGPDHGYCAAIETTVSASTTRYKEQIRDQLLNADPLPGGAVRLDLSFVVGPRRAWPNLWKATIDSLGRLLGWDAGAGEWNARDGRITDLGLHVVIDDAAANNVRIAVCAAPADLEA